MIQHTELKDWKILFEMEKICFPKEFWTEEQIKSHLEHSPGLILTIDSSVLGYALYLENQFELEILRIAVLPEIRNRGKGHLLLLELFSIAKIRPIFLEVSEKNEIAVNFYTKNGFQKISERRKYYADASSALIMKKGSAI